MTFSFRRIRPCAPTAAVRVETFEPASSDETMHEIGRIVDWHRQGAVYREAEDAMLSVLMRLQRSQMFGEPVPPPPLSLEAREAIMRQRFEEDYARPPADLWSDIHRARYGGR